MSPNQPGPYQSKFLSFAVRQTRQWLDQGRVALRRFAIAANWTAQILLHTVFVGVQAIRLAGAVVKQGIALGMAEPLTAEEAGTGGAGEPTSLLTADTPIQRTLQILQTIPLETDLPVLAESPASSLVAMPAPVPGTIVINTIARIVRTFRSRSHSLTSPLPHLSAPQTTDAHYIHAIASLLETRTLVLVSNQNQILDILTLEQQTHLRQRIAWETAHYGRYLRLRQEYRRALFQLNPENSTFISARQALLPKSLVAPVQRFLSAWKPLALLRGATEDGSRALLKPSANIISPIVSASKPTGEAIVTPTNSPVDMPVAYSFWDMSLSKELPETGGLAASGEASAVQAPSWDYIDIQATPIGYVLAPFDAFLRWVDRGLLWLEEQIAHLWQPDQWLADWPQNQVGNWFIRLKNWFRQLISRFF